MHDITVGANGMYTALPGYDYNTGIGTCDIAAMAKLLPAASAPPTGGTTTGGTTGATTGGTTGTTTGTTTGGTTGSTTGGTTGGSGTTPPATTASATASSADPRLSGGGSAAPLSLLALGVAAWTRRRRKTRK
jgi:hypothetical protein